MITVSTEQELGKKCNFGTLEKIVPLHHACLFCMCRNIENWSNLPVSSWMRLCCHYWKVLPPRNGYTFATQAIWKTHFDNHESPRWNCWLPRKSVGRVGRGGEESKTLSRHPWPQFQIAIIIFSNMLHSILCFHAWSWNSEFWSRVWLLTGFFVRAMQMLHVFRYYSEEGEPCFHPSFRQKYPGV